MTLDNLLYREKEDLGGSSCVLPSRRAYFGGKSLACSIVWPALGDPENYVEPFAGSAAMLLGRPNVGKVETINDADGLVSNFWRAVSKAAGEVAKHVDWPTNECDLFSRHSWLVRHAPALLERLHADPDYYDAKAAGWWCWGSCNWIGGGWCSGNGPWVHDGQTLVDRRQLPHLGNAGQGVNRQLPHLSAGRGVNRQLDDASQDRTVYIVEWFDALMRRTRNVRVAVGDWQRVLTESVTTRHGMTGVFFDPPYTKGKMNYAAGGVGGELADQVRVWCVANGHDERLRIVLCGHAGEHDELLKHGWHLRTWEAGKSYAKSDEAIENYKSETLWCSPHCVPERVVQASLFSD